MPMPPAEGNDEGMPGPEMDAMAAAIGVPGAEYAMPTTDGLDGIRAELARLPAFSLVVGSPQGDDDYAGAIDTDYLPAATLAEELEVAPAQAADPGQSRRGLVAMYGQGFPLAESADPSPDQWVDWSYGLWSRHAAAVEPRLHQVAYCREMRGGNQWISSNSGGPWRQPPKPKDVTRVTNNVVAPALDQRVEIVAEQRPGFRCEPENQDQRNLKKAEAQQVFCEYQYGRQRMPAVIREAAYWAGTDAVAFLHTFWDPDEGPWDERTGGAQQAAPAGPQQQAMAQQPGAPQAAGPRRPRGDAVTEVLRVEQVRVSAGASATRKPWYWVTRRLVSRAQAVRDYGEQAVDGAASDESSASLTTLDRASPWTTGPDDDLKEQETVEELTVYCEPSEYLPRGLTMKAVGRALVVQPIPLPTGRVPLVRMTDGTNDPAWLPRSVPECQGWYDHQTRINALESMQIDSVRLNRGPRFLTRPGTLATETLVAGGSTVWETRGAVAGGSLADQIVTLPGYSIGADVKETLAREMLSFERKSGWNDASRGSFQGDPSGRSVLAQREMLERVFAPPVTAAATAMAEWAEIQLAFGRTYWDGPRMVSVQGSGRPDLARELTSDDLDGVANVSVDPETLMPLPRALRLHLLDTMLDKQLISPAEYRRRIPFAFTQNLDTPDTDHYARARRAAEFVRQTMQPNPPQCPVLWQDNEAIHQDVLERELILPDDNPPPVRSAAFQRWMMLAQQAAMKAGGMPATPGGGGATQQGGKPNGGSSDGAPAAFQGTSPGVASGTASTIGQPQNPNDTNAAANRFDMTQRQ
jgi:hypothetical protein